jgi:dihydroxyacetone kinase-like predicted kinase
VVAVASGDGLARVFRQLGASELVMGGQTNNPSTQEILDAIQRLPTRQVILLPNNKNIILAAEASRGLRPANKSIVVPYAACKISALLLRSTGISMSHQMPCSGQSGDRNQRRLVRPG